MLKRNHNRAGSPPPRRSSDGKSNITPRPESDTLQESLGLIGTNMVVSGDDGPARDQEKESDKEGIIVKTPTDLMGSPSSDDSVKSKGGIQADEDDEDSEISELSNVRIPGVDDDGDSQQTKRKSWVTWVIVVIAVLLCVGLGAGVWFMNHPQAHRLDNSSKVGGNAIGYSQGSDSNGDVDPVSDVSSFMDDEGVPKYYQQPESKVDQPTREQITKDSIESAPANAEMSLMSKASNPDLTDDPSKAQNEDGTLNPNYSYVTMDNTVPLIRDDLERLVNSLYGGWSALQDPGRIGVDSEAPAFPGSSLADMFDPSVDLSSEESLRRHVPLVADWDSDGFGGALASKDPSKPIVGVIDGYDCEFDVRGEDGDHVSCTAQVSYSWKDLYGKSHDLGGKTLGLDYKVNYNDPDGRRLLLMSVTQQ